jgi:hypothetical protein
MKQKTKLVNASYDLDDKINKILSSNTDSENTAIISNVIKVSDSLMLFIINIYEKDELNSLISGGYFKNDLKF